MTFTAVPSAGTIAWAQQVLGSDSTLMALLPGGVFLGALPAGSSTPGVVLNEPSDAQDLNTLYGNPWAADVDLQVTVFGPTASMNTLATAAQRVYTLLQRATGGAAGTIVASCLRVRNRTVPQPELINGAQWYGIYQGFSVTAQ